MNQVPVTLITGFLGSGKTTLLNHLLQQPALASSAVIINELGEVGIDHLLVAAPAENMVLLDTGCLCCTIRGDLVQTLSDLHAKRTSGAIPAFEHLVIETTGLADPVPVLQTVVAGEALGRLYRLHDVVTLVDAVNGEAQLDAHPEAVKQAAVADALIVTKTDLAQTPAIGSLRARLEALNPGAEVHEVVRGTIDAAVLLRGNVYDPKTKSEDVERWLRADGFRVRTTPTLPDRSAASPLRGRGPNSPPPSGGRLGGGWSSTPHDHDIRSFAFFHERPIRRAGLVMWLDMLAGLRGAHLLRVKGVLNVEGDPVVVHAVQTVVHEPVALDAWPSDERRSRLVFIVRDMTRDEIERTFEAFDYAAPPAPKSAIDPAAYAQFVQSMKGFAAGSARPTNE